MRAMVMNAPGQPLSLGEVSEPEPGRGQLLLKVQACGICRTDLHVVDGDLIEPAVPLIPGHQIVGIVTRVGPAVERFSIGDRVGVPWLGKTCQSCRFCASGRENLCDAAQFTGYQRNGGFAEFAVADEQFAFAIPERYPTVQAAPLLCAGLIGYRALVMAGDVRRLGLYGFGAAGHIACQVAGHRGREVYAFTRTDDVKGQEFARKLGATWAGGSNSPAPVRLDAAIIFAPVGSLVPAALRAVDKGGTVVCAGIHMSDIPSFPYEILWGERTLRSVANLTRRDGEEFLALAPDVPVETQVNEYPLEQANQALDDLRHGRFEGAAVLVID
ncbi:MAG: zinc-dependent alcohol dehydrogenase family protein [Proteobacteria bacterium]|nr:zinc-dependent alcohol dehydrogenase family protein [Pseudomonadota bacterium]